MSLRYVAGVSLPRSGHHLIARLLGRYFGTDFLYCSFYDNPDCCRTFPCSRPEVNYSKSHDFNDEAKLDVGVPLLVQYRDVVPATISDFELYLRSGKEDTKAVFEQFAMTKARMWGEFVAKWVDGDAAGERLIIAYEDLTGDPDNALRSAITFCGGDVDEDRLCGFAASERRNIVTKSGAHWVEGAGVANHRRIEEFRFYDDELFQRMRERAAQVRASRVCKAGPIDS